MRTDTDDLEQQIRAAFQYRAEMLPENDAAVVSPPQGVAPSKERWPTRALVVSAAAALLVIVVFGWWVTRSPSSNDRVRIHSGSDATPTTSAPTTLPAVVLGDEAPLTEVNTDETARLVTLTQRLHPDTTGFVVVQAAGRAPVVVYRDPTEQCMTIAAAPTSAGEEGSCLPQAQAVGGIVGAVDTGPVELPTTVAYGVWASVPAGTAYVTLTYGTEHAWQRPIDGVSYFTIQGYRPPLGPEPITMRAYDSQGSELGHATRTPWQDAAGQWNW